MTYVLSVSEVSHAFGPRPGDVVVHDVSFRAGEHEIVVLAGRSGSGKSTLLHLVAGVMEPTHGSVEVLDGSTATRGDWSSVSLMPQRSAVSPELTVLENIALPAALRGREIDEQLLESLGLTAIRDRPATDTSLGEQQRISLARALVLAPALVLLDEPTSHQDDDHVELVLATMRRARDAGSTLLVATHDQRVIGLADRVVRLEQGRVVGTTP